MRKSLIGLCLALQIGVSAQLAFAEPLRVRNNMFDGKTMVQESILYASLAPLTIAIGLNSARCGDGMWVGTGAPPPDLNNVPAGQVWVHGTLVPLLNGDGGDIYVPAEQFCKALGGSTRRDKTDHGLNLILPTTFSETVAQGGGVKADGPPPSVTLPPLPADPSGYFVTQYPSQKNKQGNWKNGNCGPTCLSMAAIAYQRVPPGMLPGDRQGLILWCRESMTGGSVDESKGTNYHQMERAASQLQLNPRLLRKFSAIDSDLSRGRLVVVAGKVTKLGFTRFSGNNPNHFILVVAKVGDAYIINDPGGFYKVPGTRLKEDKLKTYFDFAVSLGPP